MTDDTIGSEHVYCAGDVEALYVPIRWVLHEASRRDGVAWLKARRDHYDVRLVYSVSAEESERTEVKITDAEYWAGPWPMEIGVYVGCTPLRAASHYRHIAMACGEAKAMHSGWEWGCAWAGTGGEKEVVYNGRRSS